MTIITLVTFIYDFIGLLTTKVKRGYKMNMNEEFMSFGGETLDTYLGHELIEIKEGYVKSKLLVNNNHKQPMGLVHGGIYSTLSETICLTEQMLRKKVLSSVLITTLIFCLALKKVK